MPQAFDEFGVRDGSAAGADCTLKGGTILSVFSMTQELPVFGQRENNRFWMAMVIHKIVAMFELQTHVANITYRGKRCQTSWFIE